MERSLVAIIFIFGLFQIVEAAPVQYCQGTGILTLFGEPCYWYGGNNLSWPDAHRDCETQGGILAVFHNLTQMQWVADNAGFGGEPWIGLSQRHTKGGYRWVTGYSLKYQTWGVGSPGRVTDGTDCVFAGADNNTHTDNCTTQREYICQTKPSYADYCANDPSCLGVIPERWQTLPQCLAETGAFAVYENVRSAALCSGICVRYTERYCKAFAYNKYTGICKLGSGGTACSSPKIIYMERNYEIRDSACYDIAWIRYLLVGAWWSFMRNTRLCESNYYTAIPRNKSDIERYDNGDHGSCDNTWLACTDYINGYYQCADESGLLLEPDALAGVHDFQQFISYGDDHRHVSASDNDHYWCVMCERPNSNTKTRCNEAPIIPGTMQTVNVSYGYVEYQTELGVFFPDYTTLKRIPCPCEMTWDEAFDLSIFTNGSEQCSRYTGICYKQLAMIGDWNFAYSACSEMGMMLAALHNETTHDFLAARLDMQGPVWIGLSQLHTENNFRWATGEDLKYNRWNEDSIGTGGSYLMTGKDCVYMDGGVWSRADCEEEHSVLCQTIPSYEHWCSGNEDCLGLVADMWTEQTGCVEAEWTYENVPSAAVCQALCVRFTKSYCTAYHYSSDTQKCDIGSSAYVCSYGSTYLYAERDHKVRDLACFSVELLTNVTLSGGTPNDPGVPEGTWQEVSDACEARGQHLAIPRTDDEIPLMLDMTIVDIPPDCDYLWLGCKSDLPGYTECRDSTPLSVQSGSIFYSFGNQLKSFMLSRGWGTTWSMSTHLPTVAHAGLCEYPKGATLNNCHISPNISGTVKTINEAYGYVEYKVEDTMMFPDFSTMKRIFCSCTYGFDWTNVLNNVYLLDGLPTAGPEITYPPSTVSPSTTVEPTTAYEATATFEPTTTYDATTTVEPTTTVELTTTYEATTTLEPTTTYNATTTVEPTTTYEATTTFEPTTTYDATTTVEPNTILEATGQPITSVKPITTHAPSTSMEATTAEDRITSTTQGLVFTTDLSEQEQFSDTSTTFHFTPVIKFPAAETPLQFWNLSLGKEVLLQPVVIPDNIVGVIDQNTLSTCPGPPRIPNARAIYRSLSVGASATYICKPGFFFPDGGTHRTIYCRVGFTWNIGVKVGCAGSDCKLGSHVAGDLKHVVCPDGFTFSNGLVFNKRQCSSGAKWSSDDTCKMRSCDPFPYIGMAEVSEYTCEDGSTVAVRCLPGHRFSKGSKSATYTCAAGQWLPQIDQCKIETCPPLTYVNNSVLNTQKTEFGTVVIVSCATGHQFPNTTDSAEVAVECVDGSLWNITVSSCTEITCHQPPTATNATLMHVYPDPTLGGVYAYNAASKYKCEPGKRLEDGYIETESKCVGKNIWEPSDVECAVGRCSPVPRIQHATANTTLSIDGTVVRYVCNPGFIPVDTVTIIDQIICDFETWTQVSFACEPSKCDPLTGNHFSVNSTASHYQAAVQVTCDRGHYWSGVSTLVVSCTSHNQWSPQFEDCEPLSCGPPEDILYTIKMANSSNTYGLTVTYTCVQGYWFSRDVHQQIAICTDAGVWQSTYHTCSEVTCPALPLWSNLIVDEGVTENKWRVGSEVNISCPAGTRFESTEQSSYLTRCTDDGKWSPDVHLCSEPILDVDIEPQESGDSGVIATAVLGTLACVVALVAILDIVSVVNQVTHSNQTKKGKAKQKHEKEAGPKKRFGLSRFS